MSSLAPSYPGNRMPGTSSNVTHSSPLRSSNASRSEKYRGATVEDLDPPPALSTSPADSISNALTIAFERDYTHLTVVSQDTRALLGYLSLPRLKHLLDTNVVTPDDPVEKAMQRFNRKQQVYKVITMNTPLEELEDFFDGDEDGHGQQDFAVITDGVRRFVLGVATRSDLEEFVRRRPD